MQYVIVVNSNKKLYFKYNFNYRKNIDESYYVEDMKDPNGITKFDSYEQAKSFLDEYFSKGTHTFKRELVDIEQLD